MNIRPVVSVKIEIEEMLIGKHLGTSIKVYLRFNFRENITDHYSQFFTTHTHIRTYRRPQRWHKILVKRLADLRIEDEIRRHGHPAFANGPEDLMTRRRILKCMNDNDAFEIFQGICTLSICTFGMWDKFSVLECVGSTSYF